MSKGVLQAGYGYGARASTLSLAGRAREETTLAEMVMNVRTEVKVFMMKS
jgi:hypothetical protein